MVWWVVATEIRSRREASPVLPTLTCVSVVAATGIRSQRVVSPGLPIVMMIPEGLGTSVQTVSIQRLALTVRISGWLGLRSWYLSWLASSGTCGVLAVFLSHMWIAQTIMAKCKNHKCGHKHSTKTTNKEEQ